MSFPLNFSDLSLWLAIMAILLLVTSEVLSPSYGKTNLYLDRRRLRKAGLAAAILFLATLAMRIASLVLYP